MPSGPTPKKKIENKTRTKIICFQICGQLKYSTKKKTTNVQGKG